MDEYEDIETGLTILAGVDLALWFRLVLLVLTAVAAGVLAITLN